MGAKRTVDDVELINHEVPQVLKEHIPIPSVAHCHLSKWDAALGRYVWIDEANVCNKTRLHILVSELHKRGLECILSGGSHWTTPLRLTVSLRAFGRSQAPCVQLDGVQVRDGRLCIYNKPA